MTQDHDILLCDLARVPLRTVVQVAEDLGWSVYRTSALLDTLRRRGLVGVSGRHGVRLLTRAGRARAALLALEPTP